MLLFVLLSASTHIVNADSKDVSFDSIQAVIQIISPVDNESYNGGVSLNISIAFETSSPTNSTVIPYQDITCIYRLDSDEWKNASLNSVSEPNMYWSLINRVFLIGINCNYSATLQASSIGVHSLNVALNPGVIHSFDFHTYYADDGSEHHYLNSTVKFYVSSNSGQTVPTGQPVIQEIVFGVATVLTVIIISTIVIVSRRRKKFQVKGNSIQTQIKMYYKIPCELNKACPFNIPSIKYH
jgi:hypothetical protein